MELIKKINFVNFTKPEIKALERCIIMDNKETIIFQEKTNGYLKGSSFFENINTYQLKLKKVTKDYLTFHAKKNGYKNIEFI